MTHSSTRPPGDSDTVRSAPAWSASAASGEIRQATVNASQAISRCTAP
ncbi:unannotated protein [freshwater metagenome]|uniref:Unannotated protein n=1 Tax=freshwater metagenome TaxID=449393 RepID=A0A6J7FYA8_9ZZZZ